MEDIIIVSEKYSNYWLSALFLFLAFSALLIIFSFQVTNVILGNYLQLSAFICFAISVFAVIKVWEGKKSIKITFEEKQLVIDIYKQKNAVQTDIYTLREVEVISLVPAKISVPVLNFSFLRKDALTFQLLLKNDDQPFFLFQFSGNIISISHSAANRLCKFFENQDLPIKNLSTNYDS